MVTTGTRSSSYLVSRVILHLAGSAEMILRLAAGARLILQLTGPVSHRWMLVTDSAAREVQDHANEGAKCKITQIAPGRKNVLTALGLDSRWSR